MALKGLRQEAFKFEASLEYIARLSPAKVKKITVGARVTDRVPKPASKLSSQAFACQTAHQHTLQGDPVSVATSQQPPCTMTSSWCTMTVPSWNPA